MKHIILTITSLLLYLGSSAQHKLIITDYTRAINTIIKEKEVILMSLKNNPDYNIRIKISQITKDSIYSKNTSYAIASIQKIKVTKTPLINRPGIWLLGNFIIFGAATYLTSPEFVVGSFIGFNTYELILFFTSSTNFDLTQKNTSISFD